MGTVREPLAEGTEGAPHLGPEQPRVYSNLSPEEKDRYNADIRATNILLQGLPKDIYTLINHYTDAKEIWDNVKMLLEGSELTKEDRESQLYDNFEHFRQHKGETIHDYYVRFAKLINDMRNIKMTMSRMQLNSKFVNNMLPEWGLFPTDNLIENLTNTLSLLTQSYKTFLPQTNNKLRTSSNTRIQSTVQDGRVVAQNVQGRQSRDEEQLLFLAGGQDNAIDKDVDEQPIQDLALNVDNVFQDDDCDAFDSNIDEAPTAQTMFMANLSSADPVNDEARPSYDSDILFEVYDHDHYQDAVCEHHEEHAMHDNVQLNHVVDSHADYTSDSNMIPYDQPKPYYNELNKVAIGFKNPLCLTHMKQVQPALYNGHEIIKDNHVSTIVHNTVDTLEIAKITRRKINDKMKDPECVTHKVKIAPHDYSKENFLATFIPQKQLTHEQIFWSQDLIKMKSEALKEQTTVSRPIKALTVYPPNTPATLVPREQFEGIQKALTKEIKEMKDVFEELEAEVAQNVVDRKHDEIKRKNLLIANDNLIAECLSKEVFSIATNSELNVARFTKMHVANTIVEARYLELEAELSNLSDKSHNDNHDELVNHFSNLELTQLTAKVTALQEQNDLFRAENDKIKQHYKELYDSIKIIRAKHIEQVTTLTIENVNLKAQILNTVNSVSKDHVKPKVLAPEKYAIDVEPIVPHLRNNREAHLDYLRHLKESVEAIHDIVEEAKVVRQLDSLIISACRYTKHSQELLDYAIGTCPQDSRQRDKKHAPAPLIRKKQVTFTEQSDTSNSNTHKHVAKLNTQKTNVHVPLSTGVNRCTDASGSHRRTDRPLVFGLRLLKTYNGGSSRLMNFMKKFTGTVRFGNDHFGATMGYGDYVIGDSVISRGRLVTAVKLNRELRNSNYDQLYAYLKQHETHANEKKMILDRFNQHTVDPLALIVVVQNVQGQQNRGQGANLRGEGAAGYRGVLNRVRNANLGQARQNSDYYKNKMLLMQAQENGVALDEEQLLFFAGGQDNAIDEDVDEQPVQDLALNMDNVFQADDCDAFDSDVDEAPMAQTMFMANLSFADPVYDEAGPSYDSDILSKVHGHDHYQDAVCEHHYEHAMHDNVQLNYVVDSHANYTSDSNMISYDQLVISDRNFKEETLKKELHYVKLQLASTINHNKLMVEEVTSLKRDFKQKENKYLEEFLDMKSLKEKVEDRLFKQDQSLQTVHMLCRPKPYYNELNKVAIGYKNPLCLTREKQVHPTLYNGHEIIKDNHVPVIVHNTEDTLEIDEITRRKMNDKMKDPECVNHKVKIAPHDYSKENFLGTFTPQKQLTPEQIFWSKDLIKMKSEALKEQTTASRPIKALTVYPPNTPTTLVPRVLPMKSQVKIHIFTLIQLLLEFDKTCKKRITPTGLIEGERGFEQTKECYL
nr:hypothetical protein [Tanacetum cinerariifolium]